MKDNKSGMWLTGQEIGTNSDLFIELFKMLCEVKNLDPNNLRETQKKCLTAYCGMLIAFRKAETLLPHLGLTEEGIKKLHEASEAQAEAEIKEAGLRDINIKDLLN